MLSDHHRIKVGISNRKISEKSPTVFRNTAKASNKTWVKYEAARETRKYFNKMKMKTKHARSGVQLMST